MSQDMKELIFRLCEAPGISGQEPVNIAAAELSRYAKVKIDRNNNVVGEMGNPNGDCHIMLDAHLDQIGFIITSVDEKGFLRFAPVGGLDRRVMAGSPVTVFGTKAVTGIVCCMPPHLSDGVEDTALPFDKMAIDVGLSGEAAKERIPVGSRGILYSEPRELLNRRLSMRALDDRCGVAALLRTAELLSKVPLQTRVTLVFSAQEETGERGIKTAAYEISPQEAIMVDVSFAKQPGVTEVTAAKLGKGPMIGVSPALDSQVTELLFQTAEKENIPYQTEVMGGTTGTNADQAAVSKGGVACGLVSIPQRNMHTPGEVVSLDDVENTAVLLANYILARGRCHG